MSSLKDQLQADLTAAMKARDKTRSSTLRMVLAAITKAEVAGKEPRELTDADVTDVLAKEAKQRREAAEAFTQGGREDSAEKELAEAAIISEFLPAQLSEAELTQLVEATIDELGVAQEGMRAMGKVMGALQPKIAGRADGGVVAGLVRARLSAS